MAIFHMSGQIISRLSNTGSIRSAIACAAYRSGEKLHDISDGTNKFYARDVQPEAYILKPNNAPDWVLDREILWNKVEASEKAYNAQLAREFNIALPRELSNEEQTKLALDFCQKAFVDRGMVADISIHRDHPANPHFHVMLTMREFDENGKFKPKSKNIFMLDENGNRIPNGKGRYKRIKIETNDWNKRENMQEWRKLWETMTNDTLLNNGIDARISCESYKNSNIELYPTVHEGYVVRQLEARGVKTEIGDINRERRELNATIIEIKEYKKKKEEKKLEIIARCFSPLEKKILRDTARTLKCFVTPETVEKRLTQLKKWENSVLRNGFDDKSIDRIFAEREDLEKADSIFKAEAERFILKYYENDIDIRELSDQDMISIANETAESGSKLSKYELDQVILRSRENEFRKCLNYVVNDTNRFMYLLAEEIEKTSSIIDMEAAKMNAGPISKESISADQARRIDAAKSIYHIYQRGNESKYFIGQVKDKIIERISDEVSISEAKLLWKKAVSGDLSWCDINDNINSYRFRIATEKLEKLEDAVEILEKIYDVKLKQLYPDINVERYNIYEKEILVNAKEYYGDELSLGNINEVVSKYSTADQHFILEALETRQYAKIKEAYPEFDLNSKTYINMFMCECKINPKIDRKAYAEAAKAQDVREQAYLDESKNYNLQKGILSSLGVLLQSARYSSDSNNSLAKIKKKRKHKRNQEQEMGLS